MQQRAERRGDDHIARRTERVDGDRQGLQRPELEESFEVKASVS